MRILKCFLVHVFLLNIFCISLGKPDDKTIEKPVELTFFEDLQHQFTELKILRMRDKMKFETEIKSLQTKFQNFEELHLADKTEILNLKTEVKSLTSKILAMEGDLKPDSWILQPLMGPPGVQGQKGDSGEKGVAGTAGEQGERGQPGEQGSPGSSGVTGQPGLRGQKGETGQAGPMGPGGPEGKVGSKGNSGAPGPKGEIGLPGIIGPRGEKGEAGFPGEFPITEIIKINKTLENVSSSLQKLEVYPRTCNEIISHLGPSQSKHRIYPNGRTELDVEVLCDFETGGEAWTIIQKRSSGPKEEFYRNWTEYERGFGSLVRNYWIGLKTIHALTKDGDQELRIDLWDFEGEHAYAKYSTFSISDSTDFYRLTIGGYSGYAGNSISGGNGMRFSTHDKDNDPGVNFNCAEFTKGAWWYEGWGSCNLNGFYYEKGETPNPSYSGMYWNSWTGSLRSLRQVEMKIRRRR